MPDKSLQQMAVPLVVSFTLRFLFTFVDMAYAAQLADDNAAVAAIGFYAPVQAIYIAVWVGLSAGFTAALSNAFGHRDEARIGDLKRSLWRILAVLIPALILFGIGVWFTVPHLGLEPRLAESFRTYATTLTIGMPLAGFWAIYPDSIVKAHQDTRSTMVAGLASTITNVALNTWFVFGLEWGIFGIALATVLSRFAGLAYAMHRTHVLEQARERGAAPEPRSWPSPVSTILKLSLPGALTWLLASLEGAVVNKVLTGLPDSTTTIAAYAVYAQMLQFALMPAAGTSVAVVPYVARLLPSGDVARIRRDLGKTLLMILGLGVVMTVCMGWIFAEPLAGFFVERKNEGEADAAISAIAVDALRLLPIGILAAVPFFMLRPVFEAAHRPNVGIRLSIARFVLLSPPLILLGSSFGPDLGLDGLRGMILGMALATGLASLLAATMARQTLAEQCP